MLFECCCGMGLGRMPYVSGEERGCWLHLFKCSLYLMVLCCVLQGCLASGRQMFHPWRVLFPSDGKGTFLLRKRIGIRLVEGSAVSCLCSIVGIRGEGSCLGKVRLTLDRVKGIWCLWQTPLDEYFADSRRMCIFAVHWLGEP